MPKHSLLAEIAPARSAGEGAQPAEGPTYRVAYAKDGCPDVPGVSTCYDIFSSSVREYPERPALAYRPLVGGEYQPYKSISYALAARRAGAVGSAFAALGAKPHDRVGVFGMNSPEWMLSLQGCNRMSLVCTPIYDTLGENAVEYIINHAGIRVVCSAGAKLAALSQALPALQTPLLAVIYWGDAPEAAVQAVQAAGSRALSWEEALALGEKNPSEPVPPKPEDLCTIMYTSGTTGAPKGVMHTHSSVLATVSGARAFLKESGLEVTSADSYFSFLTLAHIFDRVVEEVVLLQGGCVGYVSDMRRILDDCASFRPTYFAGVPRVFERVYSGVWDKVKAQGRLTATIFRVALLLKGLLMRLGFQRTPFLDGTVFKRTSAALGGRVRGILSGAAPLPRHVEDFLKATMGCPIMQGYGLTESCAASFVTFPSDPRQTGTVGPPFPCVELRLEGVPEMGYSPLADPPRGEVCLRGASLFKGYYRMPDMTAEAYDADGFFHTGDVGELTREGALRIIDRKKNIFKLSQGEYVAVEKLESVLSKCELVEQIWLYGNSYESVLVAVVHPARKALLAWAEAQGVQEDYEALCRKPAAAAHVLQQLAVTGKAGRLKGFEFPKAVHLEPVAFSVENDLMTPKFSLKRPNLLKHYKQQVDSMYAKLRAAEAAKGAAPSKKAA